MQDYLCFGFKWKLLNLLPYKQKEMWDIPGDGGCNTEVEHIDDFFGKPNSPKPPELHR